MPSEKKSTTPAANGDFETLVVSIVQIHHHAQDFATKAVNVSLTIRNWLIGNRIVEFEQKGEDRAAYGERLLPTLAKRLAAAGLRRVDTRELRRFRLLYNVYPQIRETLTPELLAQHGMAPLMVLFQPDSSIRESVTPESQMVEPVIPRSLSIILRLSFTHLAEIIQLKAVNAPEVTAPVTGQVSEQVSEQVVAIINASAGEPRTKRELLEAAGLANAYLNYKRHLLPLLEQAILEMTLPGKPNSRLQKYRLTAQGRTWLSRHPH